MELKDIEVKIIRLIARELSSSEIGEALGVPARTIEDYRLELHKKIGVKTAVGLVMYGVRNGIIKVRMA